jgi:hypothetical protein
LWLHVAKEWRDKLHSKYDTSTSEKKRERMKRMKRGKKWNLVRLVKVE